MIVFGGGCLVVLLLWAGALCLVTGAVLLRRRPALACASGVMCSKPAVRGLTMMGLYLYA
jgi:mercuric ion transport protein